MIRFFVKHVLVFVVLLVAFSGAMFVGCTGSDCNDDGNCAKSADGGGTEDGAVVEGGGGDTGPQSGDAGTPVLALDRTTFDFGTVASSSTSAPATFTVSNTGDAATDALTVTLGGADAAVFKLDATACTGTKLEAGKKCEVSVTFAPTGAGAAVATLSVTSSNASAPMATLAATGAATGALTITPSGEGFGVTLAGSRSADQSFTVTNTGNAATGTLSVTLTGTDAAQFKTSADTCGGKTLAAGATCQLALRFAPTVIGAHSASLVIAGAPGGTATTGVFGVAIAGGQLTLSPTSFEFPAVLEGTNGATQQFSLTNTGLVATGSIATTLGGSQAADFKVTADGCAGKTLASGDSCTFTVQFAPAKSGAKVASVSVTGDPGGAAAAALAGTGLGQAAITITPSPQNFGTVVQGQQSTAVLTLKNTGGVATGTPTLVAGTSGDFSFTNNCAGPIDPGNSCTITVAVTATQTGMRTGTLTVNASPGGSTSVSLSANAVAPGALSLSPPTYDFGPVPEGSTTAATTFTVTNTGGSTSGVPAVSITGSGMGQFAITSNGCTAALPANGTCMIDVTFSPTTSTPSASLTVVANPGGTAISTLSGTGETPASLGISPLTFSFADTVIGASSAAKTFTVTNNGDLATSGLSVGVGGTDAAQFTVGTNTCAGTLAGHSSCTIDVAFSPTSAGAKSASLSVSATTGGSVAASLGGTGLVDATLAITTATSYDFSSLEINVQSTASYTFTIKNTGDVQSGPISVSNSNASELNVTADGCTGQMLVKNQTCNITVKFKPTSYGARSGTLTISATPGGSVVATATATGKWRLTVTRVGGSTATTISTSDGTISACGSATCTGLFSNGTSLTVQARTTSGSGYHFSGWSGGTNSDDCSGSARDCTYLAMNKSRSFNANFSSNTYNLMFKSSVTYAANAHTPASAWDSVCNTLAANAGLDASGWVAWMSDSSGGTTAASRLSVTGGFRRLDDRPFATTKANMYAGQILNPPNVDEHGVVDGSDTQVWGGTSDSGTSRGASCSNWTVTTGSVDVGRSIGGPGLWTVGYSSSCSGNKPIYCFQNKNNTTVPAATVPVGGKIAYYTPLTFTPGSGLAAADQQCANNKPTGFTTRTYVAYISSDGVAATSRIDATATYYRPDGNRIASGAELTSGALQFMTSGIWQRNDLSYGGGLVSVWGGSFYPTLAGQDDWDCGVSGVGWKNGTSGQTGYAGEVNTIQLSSSFAGLGTVACNQAKAIYCFEQ